MKTREKKKKSEFGVLMCARVIHGPPTRISLYDEIQRNLFVRFSSPTIFFVYVFFLVHISWGTASRHAYHQGPVHRA